MKISTFALLLLTSVSWLGGCSRQESAAGTQIVGIIHYRTPVNFAAGAVLELRLTDVSISDGPALEVAKLSIDKVSALPYEYSLPYDAAKIDAQHRYTVDARILIDNKLRFSTDTAHTVLTQGAGSQRDITVIAVGETDPSLTRDPPNSPTASVVQSELRIGQEVSMYKAGMHEGHLVWLEEDRTHSNSQPLHARYEFKGALIMRYIDTSPMEVDFDERGRPTGIVKNNQALKLSEQTDIINALRNRAGLLRSHALAVSEARAHRQATGG